MPHVLAHMIGVPFLDKGRDLSGFDCWGAVQYGLKRAFGVEVPSYAESYTTTKEQEEIADLIGRKSMGWHEVSRADARPGDVIILRIDGEPWHCGLVLDPPNFIHTSRVVGTVLDRWDGLLWKKRIVALYRHPEMMKAASA